MTPNKYVDVLKKYLAGQVRLEQLRDIVNDRLFELRIQSPELTKEGEFLAGIELILEEIKDGFRTEFDLAEYIRSLLQYEEPVISWKIILPEAGITSSTSTTSEAANIEPKTIIIPEPAFA